MKLQRNKLLVITMLVVLVTPAFVFVTKRPAVIDSTQAAQTLLPLGSGVMLQAFYWDVPLDWYTNVSSHINEIASAGFDNIWLPPPSKTMNGRYSMGYDPYDYYDIGSYNQKGSIATRFGTETQLRSLITSAKAQGLHVTADIVMNHNSGGDLQYNPNTGTNTYTDFSNVSSGKFQRGYNDFHPSTYEVYDEGIFGGYPDVAHANPYVANQFIQWGQWLRDDVGFTDWRFDYVKGYHASMVQDWMNNVGGYGVGEYWDSNVANVQGWLSGTGWTASAFDFPLYYTLRDMSTGGGGFNMANLDHAGLAGSNPFSATTFVTNHDTNEIYDMKEMAYAYILMSEGYPTVFWSDYFDWGFKDSINTMINVRQNYAGGSTSTLYSDGDLYIMQRNGYGSQPGMVLMMNDGNTWKGQWVQTKWGNTQLVDAMGRANPEYTQSNGWVEIWAPPQSFTIWIPQ